MAQCVPVGSQLFAVYELQAGLCGDIVGSDGNHLLLRHGDREPRGGQSADKGCADGGCAADIAAASGVQVLQFRK